MQQKAWICGPPQHFIETFRYFEEKYPGLEDIVLQWPEGMPWSEFSSQLEIFSQRSDSGVQRPWLTQTGTIKRLRWEVIPAFSGRG